MCKNTVLHVKWWLVEHITWFADGYWGVCMWCNGIDWLSSGEVGVISAWSMHVHYVEARWEVTCKELTLFMQLGAKYTYSASLTPHNHNYIHSTCYNLQDIQTYIMITLVDFMNSHWSSLSRFVSKRRKLNMKHLLDTNILPIGKACGM